jgi:hypothetical protein
VAKKTPKKAVKKKAVKKAPAKKSVKKSVKKGAVKPPTSRAKKVISLHTIVAEIDKAISALEKKTTRSPEAGNKVAAARVSLAAARSAVESACVPNFDFPEL